MNWSSKWSIPEIKNAWVEIGDLGVVKSDDGWEWSVKHIPTGTKFDKAVPPSSPQASWSKDQLIRWCQRVQEQRQEDWKALAALTKDNYKDNTYELRLRIREWCLSVEVDHAGDS